MNMFLQIYALDNINQEIHWSYMLNKKYEPFPASSEDFEVRIPLYIQRTYRHYPHPMQCTILIKQRVCIENLIFFNPKNVLINELIFIGLAKRCNN